MTTVENVYEILARIAASDKCQHWSHSASSVWSLLHHLDITEEDVNSLNIIHVAGSKGKGSTSALIENVLRANGLKTGLFVSPHVVRVTERICINGKPIEDEKFVEIFQRLWSGKGRSICEEYDKIRYIFVFFCMALRAFIDAEVDVAVIEVGIGGEYDVTNVIPKPVVCAVTLLEIEHANLLGNDIASIAWHKSGIFKPGAKALTIPQKEAAMEVLKQRAEERQCELKTVPQLSHYMEEWNRKIEVGLRGKFQSINASLAIAACVTWMRKMGRIDCEKQVNGVIPECVKDDIISGLKKTAIMGRFQIIERPGASYYIDLAHTKVSMTNAVEWFEECCTKKAKNGNVKMSKIVVFCAAEDKDVNALVHALQGISYDKIVLPVCHLIHESDTTLRGQDNVRLQTKNIETAEKTWKLLDPTREENSYKKFKTINEAVAWITAGRDDDVYSRATESLDYHFQDESAMNMDHLQVFVTGSFALVRGFLTFLQKC